ncbi:MAG: hypothetical protein ABI921_07430, partial [Panacibacter sp.]
MKTIIFSVIYIICIYTMTWGHDSDSNKTPSLSSFAALKNIDTLTINLCGVEGGAFNIPWSVDLPKAQDIPGFPDTTAMINFLQNKVDIMSWKTFIALNWPATQKGGPDSAACFTENKGITVWENWMPSTKIFVP